MALSDVLHEALPDMEMYIARRPDHLPEHQRYLALCRSVTTAMRILQLYEDLVPANNDAFVIRAMELIQSNDQRPWEDIMAELMQVQRTPSMIPSDDRVRMMYIHTPDPVAPTNTVPPDNQGLDERPATSGDVGPLAPTQQATEAQRRIEVNDTSVSSSGNRPQESGEELRRIYIP